MEALEFEVKLFDTTSLAADGSNIPRRSCEEYLTSTKYVESIRDKVSIGGLTHKDRKLKPELKGVVGMDDQVLINDNALFYITKLYFKDNDNFFYARAKTFDPDLFEGKRKENIINLIGMLKSGVRMPVSVVIQALWSKRGVAEKIIMIKGFDFTQNPSFKGAGDIKLFSEVINDNSWNEDQVREFSSSFTTGEVEYRTQVFSSESDVSIFRESDEWGPVSFSKVLEKYPDQKSFSYSDIISVYGQSSDQSRYIRNLNGRLITREMLFSTGDGTLDPDEFIKNPELSYWLNEVNKYTEEGDRDKLQTLFRENRDRITNIINSVPDSDPNKSELIKARLDQFFRTVPNNEYSATNPATVADRVRTSEMPRYTRFARTIKAYQQYIDSKKLNELQMYQCKLMFLQDINLFIKEVLPQVFKGQTFNALYALNQYGPDIKNTGLELSATYRKLMISEKIMKFIPKGVYGEWMVDMKNFYQALLKFTFGQGLTDIQLNLIDLK